MGYREEFFKANPGITIPGKRGKQYRCVCCGGFYPKSQIDVDHIISKRNGGVDELWNLQAMCQHCNRSKGRNSSGVEYVKSSVGAIASGDTDKLVKGIVAQGVKDLLGIKYKR